MKPALVIPLLLVGALLAGDCALALLIDSASRHWPQLPGVFLTGASFGQTMLLGVWLALGRVNMVPRMLLTVPALVTVSVVGATATGELSQLTAWFAVNLILVSVMSAPLLLARLSGWQLCLNAEPPTAPWRVHRQFSIWGLLSATTAVAIALGLARHVQLPMRTLGEAFLFFCSLTVIALLVLLPALRIAPPGLAALVTGGLVLFACSAGGILVGWSGVPPEEPTWVWACFGIANGATIAAASLVLRVAGYRLVCWPES